jgi:hypothetical protein
MASTAVDVAIGGVGFLLANSQQTPYGRATAPYRKEQFDSAQEAGEQTLDFWWLRSQSSFHGGAGLLYFEQPGGDDETNRIRFDASKNVDVWTPGKVTKLPDTTRVIVSGSTCGGLVGARRGTDSYAVTAFGASLSAYKLPDAGSPTTVTYTWGGTDQIQSLVSDGKSYFAASATGVYSGPIDASGSGAKIWNSGTTPLLGWVKQRLMAGIANSVYELVGTGPSLPTAKYTHPNTDWRWTAFADSPAGILAAGYSGDESAVYLFELDSAGAAPTLSSGVIAAQLPSGERVYSMTSYAAGTFALGTSRGVRLGGFSSDGSPVYGPLSLTTTLPVRGLAGRGDYLYGGGSRATDSESSLLRIDIGTQVDKAGRFAWASDLLCPTAQTGDVAAVAVMANRMVFAVDGYGLVLEGAGPGTARTGWLRTSRVRYSTAEPKLFKRGRVRGDFADGVTVYGATPSAAEAVLLTVAAALDDPEEFSLLQGAQEWFQLRFEMPGGELRSWQIKALPATKRQRLIQLALSCADNDKDRAGLIRRGRGTGWSRLRALEEMEEAGDVVTYESRLPYGDESRLCVIDKVEFQQDKQSTPVSGLSGVVIVTLRTVD